MLPKTWKWIKRETILSWLRFWENVMFEHSLEANPDIRNGIILHRNLAVNCTQTAGGSGPRLTFDAARRFTVLVKFGLEQLQRFTRLCLTAASVSWSQRCRPWRANAHYSASQTTQKKAFSQDQQMSESVKLQVRECERWFEPHSGTAQLLQWRVATPPPPATPHPLLLLCLDHVFI